MCLKIIEACVGNTTHPLPENPARGAMFSLGLRFLHQGQRFVFVDQPTS